MNTYRCIIRDSAYGVSFPVNVLAKDRLSAYNVIQAHTASVNKGGNRYVVTELIELVEMDVNYDKERY